MPPKKGSPDKSKGKGSPDKSKGSPEKKGKKGSPDKKGSPKKGKDVDVPEDEEEIVVAVPFGIMHHRMRFLLKNELKSDIEFLVGPEHAMVPIKAHKCVLAAESPVFEQLFADIEAGRTKEAAQAAEDAAKEKSDSKASAKKGGKGGSPDKKEKDKSPKKKSPDKSSPDKKSPKKDKSPDKKGGKAGGKGGEKGSPGEMQGEMNFQDDEVLNTKEIAVPDVHPEGFHKILRYIYHDEIVYNGVVGVLRTMYAARKYMLSILYRACVEYLENNVTIEHVLKLLKAGFDFHEDRLKALCLDLIVNETFEVINRQEFPFVDRRLIELILEQDILNIREIELYDRVMHWAENECEKIGIMVTSRNQRVALGPILHDMIRYPTMLPHEFTTHVATVGVLKIEEEVVPILSYYITGRIPNLPYSCKIRRRPCLNLAKLETDSVAFSDDTDITFVGYASFPRRANSYKDLTIPIPILPTPRQATLGIIPRLYRTTSVPDKLQVTPDIWSMVEANIHALKDIDDEKKRYEFAKKNLVLLRRHYK